MAIQLVPLKHDWFVLPLEDQMLEHEADARVKAETPAIRVWVMEVAEAR